MWLLSSVLFFPAPFLPTYCPSDKRMECLNSGNGEYHWFGLPDCEVPEADEVATVRNAKLSRSLSTEGSKPLKHWFYDKATWIKSLPPSTESLTTGGN